MAPPHPLLIEVAAGRPIRPADSSDGRALLASAREHRMTGLLWSLVEHGDVVLPRGLCRQLALDDLATRGHHTRLWRAFHTIQERLSAIDVEVALVKGIGAELQWYTRLGERPCIDLDVLIAPAARPRIDEILATIGGTYLPQNAGQLLRSGVLQSLDIDTEGVELDLHVDLLKLEVPMRTLNQVWSRTHLVSSPLGGSVRVLDEESALVHFLIHLHKDRFARLAGYADVARILQRTTDWSAVDRLVATEGLTVPAYSALRAVVSSLGLRVPPLSSPVGPRALAWDLVWPARSRLQGRKAFNRRLNGTHLAIPMLATGRLSEAVRWWLRRRLFPPPSIVDLYYGDLPGPYLIRLVGGRVRKRWRTIISRRKQTPA